MGRSNMIIALWQAAVLGVWGMVAAVEGGAFWLPTAESCSPPLFVFGASYLDVGENAAAMPFRQQSEREPYGLDYFDGQPSGRYSNGRLIIDHISQGLDQEFLSPYLRLEGASFSYGVNFASSGSKARNSSFTGDGSDSTGLFSLSVQVDQFRAFRKQALVMYRSKLDTAGRWPTPEDFSRGVYIIESGNNDYKFRRGDQTDEAMIPSVLGYIEHAVRALFLEGARTIFVMDLFPRGCFPGQLATQVSGPDELTDEGCWIPTTKTVDRHNAELRVMIPNLNAELPGAKLVVFSLHDVFMSAIRNPSKFGLKYVHKACCGYGGGDYNYNHTVDCGTNDIVDGQRYKSTVCANRSEYLMWDAMHPTDSFAFHVAQAFLNGEHMQPPTYIKEMCSPQVPNSL